MESVAYNKDCLAAMREMPDKAFDLAVVDPPYGIDCAQTINIPNRKRGFAGLRIHAYKEWDASIPSEEYFREVRRVSRNQIIWGGNYFTAYLSPVKGWIIWDKKDTKTQGSNFSDVEMAWSSFKSPTKLFQYGWIGIDYCNKDEQKIHPTQKPIALYRWLLTNYAKPGDRILDTHLGSGSSRIAAYDLGFDFVGYELDKDYFDAQEERFAVHASQPKLFEPAPAQPVQLAFN